MNPGSRKKQAVVLLGPPGSGKGTQANLLAEEYGLELIETSKAIEAFFRSGSPDDKVEIGGEEYPVSEEKRRWKEGELCSPPFVFWLLKQKIRKTAEQEKGVVFSGSPRTISETKILVPFLKELYGKEGLGFFFLELSAEDSVWRNSHRRICSLMRHPVLWNEETEELEHCPLDGSALLKRELDKPEIIRKRYRVFEKKTLPILEWLEENGYELVNVDGSPSVAEVFGSIKNHMEG